MWLFLIFLTFSKIPTESFLYFLETSFNRATHPLPLDHNFVGGGISLVKVCVGKNIVRLQKGGLSEGVCPELLEDRLFLVAA